MYDLGIVYFWKKGLKAATTPDIFYSFGQGNIFSSGKSQGTEDCSNLSLCGRPVHYMKAA